MTRALTPVPLSAEAFAPFGDVIETKEAERFLINEGTTTRFHDLAKVETGADGHTLINIFRGQPRARPIEIKMMENHPLGSQAFAPLRRAAYLVVVAPAGAPPGPLPALPSSPAIVNQTPKPLRGPMLAPGHHSRDPRRGRRLSVSAFFFGDLVPW